MADPQNTPSTLPPQETATESETSSASRPLSRRHWLASAAVSVAAVRGHAQDRKPNLLFLIADDHAGYVLGADGNRQAQTPHLDRLAAEGTRFANHYCNSPVCTPSRQSILSGLLPHAAGVTVLQTPLANSQQTLAKQLAASGYDTAVFGKMHFNQPGAPGLHGFQQAITEDIVQRQWLEAVGPAQPPADIRTKPVWRPFRDPARIWLNADALPFPRAYPQMRSTWVVEQASHYLQDHRDTPFALWVSLQEPHSPFDFPLEDRGHVAPNRFEVPKVGPEDHGQIPTIFRSLSPEDKQGIIAAYYASVAYLDRNIGVVLRKLAQLGLERDTLVVYMADHGYSLGQHGRFEKHCCYDPALRVPLLFRLPGRVKANGTVKALTESVDVAPTLLDLLGAERFARTQGQSLRPYLEGRRAAQPRASIMSEYLENEEACLRTSRWKLVHCTGRRARTDGYITDTPTPGRIVRLYDLQADPGEFTNVAARHPEVTASLSRQLLARFRQTHPETPNEPGKLDTATATATALDWYLRPRDAQASPAAVKPPSR